MPPNSLEHRGHFPHWRELLLLSSEELAGLDIAVMNLACAVGLPGSERIDATRCLKCLDDWAVGVREVTQQAVERDFRRNAAVYDHSEPLFRMVTLVRALQVRCGVLYNPTKVNAKRGD